MNSLLHPVNLRPLSRIEVVYHATVEERVAAKRFLGLIPDRCEWAWHGEWHLSADGHFHFVTQHRVRLGLCDRCKPSPPPPPKKPWHTLL